MVMSNDNAVNYNEIYISISVFLTCNAHKSYSKNDSSLFIRPDLHGRIRYLKSLIGKDCATEPQSSSDKRMILPKSDARDVVPARAHGRLSRIYK